MDRGGALDEVCTMAPWATRWFATSGNEDVIGVSVGWTDATPRAMPFECAFRAASYEEALATARTWLDDTAKEVP